MGETRKKLSKMRTLIGNNLRKSVQEIPQVSGNIKVDCTEMQQLQKQLLQEGHKVSDTVFLIKAIAVALKDFPEFNSRLEGDEVIVYDTVNAGIAVNTKMGLMVGVLKDVQDKSLLEISAGFKGLMDKLKNNKLSMDDINGGTFTISNLSKSRSLSFSSIINNNECFIMGMGGIHKEAVVLDDGTIAARDVCNVIINLNHVLVDGLAAAFFMERLGEVLDHPCGYME